LYFISDVMYLVLYHVAGYRRKVVRENLANAFPEKSVAEQKEIEKKFYRFLPDVIVETVKMRSLSKKNLKKRFQFTNPELVAQYMAEGKQVVCVTAHYANWEMGIHGLNMISDDPVLIVYKPLANADFNLIFNKIRARFGAVMVPMKQTLRYIVRYKDVPHLSV